MIKVAIGHSEGVDSEDIVEEIIQQCDEHLGDLAPKAGLLFAAVDLEYQEILDGLLDRWPDLQLIGCSTDGECSSELGFVEDSVSLTLFASDDVDISIAVAKDISQNMEASICEAVTKLKAGSTQEHVLCLSTPSSLTASSEEVVDNLKKQLGSEITLLGANAGDAWQFKRTFQFFGSEVLTDAVPMILFSGPLQFSTGVYSGWKAVGKIGVVTKSAGNVVEEIDGKKALSFYRDLLGEQATPTGDRPLAILDENGKISRLRASMEQFDEETGTIDFFGEFPEQSKVQITMATRDEILSGTQTSVNLAKTAFPKGATVDAAIFFSCSARKLLLGTQTEKEFEVLRDALGEKIPVSGFYGYGELGPAFESQRSCEFHNETFVTLLLGS